MKKQSLIIFSILGLLTISSEGFCQNNWWDSPNCVDGLCKTPPLVVVNPPIPKRTGAFANYVHTVQGKRNAFFAMETPTDYASSPLDGLTIWGLMAAAGEAERAEGIREYFVRRAWKFDVADDVKHRIAKDRGFHYDGPRSTGAWAVYPQPTIAAAETWEDVLKEPTTFSDGRAWVRMTYTGTPKGWKHVRKWARNRGLDVNDAGYGINCIEYTYDQLVDMNNDIRNRGWADKIRIASVGAPFQTEGNRLLLQAGVKDLRSMKKALHKEIARREGLMRERERIGGNMRQTRI